MAGAIRPATQSANSVLIIPPSLLQRRMLSKTVSVEVGAAENL
jgi:hypothetical protein